MEEIFVLAKYTFTVSLTAPIENLIKIAIDYENLSHYTPPQLEEFKVIEQNNNKTITKEILLISIFKKRIEQKSLHKIISDNELYSEIISGPAQGTTINVLYEKIESGTKVTVNMDLKLSLSTKLLQPLVKKYYKLMITSILYRMNTAASELDT